MVRNNPEERAHEQTIIVLLFFHMNGLDKYLQSVKMLPKERFRIRICPDPEILQHYKVEELARQIGIDDWITLQDLERHKEQIDHIYIPVLPFGVVSDIRQLNDARPAIRMLFWTLMKGRQVTAYTAGSDPYHLSWEESGLNQGSPFLKREIKSRLQQIKSFGIRLINDTSEMSEHFSRSNQKEMNQIITAATIKKMGRAGEHILHMTRDTIITPLARDLVQEYQIDIEKSGGSTDGTSNRRWESYGNKKR